MLTEEEPMNYRSLENLNLYPGEPEATCERYDESEGKYVHDEDALDHANYNKMKEEMKMKKKK